MNTRENQDNLLTKFIPISEKGRELFGCYSIIYLGTFQEKLRLHSVVTLVIIKRSMVSTYK